MNVRKIILVSLVFCGAIMMGVAVALESNCACYVWQGYCYPASNPQVGACIPGAPLAPGKYIKIMQNDIDDYVWGDAEGWVEYELGGPCGGFRIYGGSDTTCAGASTPGGNFPERDICTDTCFSDGCPAE